MRYVDLNAMGRKKRGKKFWFFLVVGVFVVLFSAGFFFLAKTDLISALLTPISFVYQKITRAPLKQTDGKVNTLILGLDTREGGGTKNTDTIIVAAYGVEDASVALISLPRDLWVNYDSSSAGKINAAYFHGGVDLAADVVAGVLGIPIHYYAVIDFSAFEEIIDALGGIEVCVERAFDDYSYPVPGRENLYPISSRYEHLHFEAGCQKMDADRALKFSRSRMAGGEEGTDFARTKRQQKVILAAIDKFLSIETLLNPVKVAQLYGKFSKLVETNGTLGEVKTALDIARAFKGQGVQTLVVDPEGGLVYPPANRILYGGAYVLLPVGGDFSKIHERVTNLLFSKVE